MPAGSDEGTRTRLPGARGRGGTEHAAGPV